MMRKPDLEVREVVCSETGKPMVKIPLWMADIKVKFISDEARQKHPSLGGIPDVEAARALVGGGDLDDLKSVDAVVVLDDADADFEDAEVEEEAGAEDDY